MIWIVKTINEQEVFDVQRIFKPIQECFGRKNVSLIEVSQDDKLKFVKQDDIILAQTRNNRTLTNVKATGVKCIAGNEYATKMSSDKISCKNFLLDAGVLTPAIVDIATLSENFRCIVKPRHGGGSIGIEDSSVCSSTADVVRQYEKIEAIGKEPIMEEFIDGQDCTVAVLDINGKIETYAISIDVDNKHNILSFEDKWKENEYCEKCDNDPLNNAAKNAFVALGAKHYMRIDFRVRRGVPYCIDLNLYPDLGPTDHFAKCLLLSANISYKDALRKVVETAKQY